VKGDRPVLRQANLVPERPNKYELYEGDNMKATDLEPTYRTDDNDIVMKRDISDSRKPRITLASLNKLKKMRAAKDLENLMRGDFLEIIYGADSEEAQGGGL